MKTLGIETPVRVGIFNTIHGANIAVQDLLEAGFTKDQITVICSDETIKEVFHEFEHQRPAGSNTKFATATGSVIGITLIGGLTSIAAVTTGGVGVLAAGGILSCMGGVLGGFIGAMMTQGIDKELAIYYDQAVEHGKILVAAQDTSEHQDDRLIVAEQVLARAGAEPVELPIG